MPDLMEQLDQAIDMLLRGDSPASSEPALSALTKVAGRLRHLPDDRFKTRLLRELVTGSPAGDELGIHTIMPFISVPEGEKLIEFMKGTFDAVETHRHAHGPDGFVASVKIGDSDLLVMGGESLRGQESSAALHVYVKDCDEAYRRALEMGAVTIGPGEPADRPYGERAAFVADVYANNWFIATRTGERPHVVPYVLSPNAPTVLDFLKRAFGAQVEAIHEAGGRIMHAVIRMGEAKIEMGQGSEALPHPLAFYIRTENVDALYRRAMAAGATSVLPPADQAFGERLAIVADPAGNRWLAVTRVAG